MAQNSKGLINFFGNLSIGYKLTLVFFLIGVLLLSQTLISLNSINRLDNSYTLTNLQGDIKETSLNIDLTQRREESEINNWIVESRSGTRSNYEIIEDFTDDLYASINILFEDLNALNPSDELNVSAGENILLAMNSLRTDLVAIAANSIFTSPTRDILDGFELLLEETRSKFNELGAQLAFYLFEGDPEIEKKISVELVIRLQTLLPEINLVIEKIGDPELSGFVRPGIGLAINHTLYKEFSDDLIILRAFRDESIARAINIITDFKAIGSDLRLADNQTIDNFQTEFKILNGNITQGSLMIDSLIDKINGIRTDLSDNFGEYITIIETLSLRLFDLAEWATKGQVILLRSFLTTVALQQIIVLIVLVFAILLFIGIVTLVNSQLAKPIRSIAHWSEMISQGDLSKTQKMTMREDEIGQLQLNFKIMNVNLRGIIGQVQESSTLISTTSEDLATSTQEINATAEEVSAIAQTMAKGSTEQAEIITTIVQELQQSSDVVDEVVTQITENLAIIKDLSEQTNILALNTAIEAANAGDFARGFTVIAENIRKMSDQSRRTSQRVSKESREILIQLQESFSHISEMIENVASVSEETAASAEEVAASAEEMTASLQNIAASSSILNQKSAESLETVSQFRLE